MRCAIFAVMFVALSGCGLFDANVDECVLPEAAPLASPEEEGFSAVTGASKVGTVDSALENLAQDVSGFGGFYLESGQLSIYLLEPDQQAAEKVRDRLAGIYNSRDIKEAPVRAVQGQYDYIQLRTWYRAIKQSDIFQIEPVSTDIKESKNRLRIGLANESSRQEIEGILLNLEIPLEAVLIEQEERAQKLPGC